MKTNSDTISYVKVFFWLIFVLIVFSLIYRFVNLVLNSSFKNNSFSILYVSEKSKIINVDEKDKSVSFISVGDVRNIIKGKNPFVASIALGMPINGIIIDENQNLNPEFEEFVSFGNEVRLILSFKTDFRDFNEFDLHKILSIARSAEKKNVRVISVDLVKEEKLEEKLEGAFLDRTVIDSSYTVEIVNGTEVNGLASSVASVLSLKGYNIIFLQTINGKFDESSYLGFEFEKNDFISSLNSLTKFEFKKQTISKTSDVTIYLGRDLETQFSN